ncbi:MAG: hypothetical protein PHQ86_06645 [Dehalococcoidales bacterium]|nr:hypothetical protein [Dehalococcoidales bacterium]
MKKIIFTIFIALVFAFGMFFYLPKQEVQASGWLLGDWLYRVRIDIDPAKVDADLVNYPVYVNLNNLPAGFHTNVNQTDARDIRVTTSDGETEVPREVVFYTAATDTGELHFKGDISGTAATSFYIYYGNGSACDYATNTTFGAQNVWTNSYQAVYHLQQDPSGNGVDAVKDSTANTYHLTPFGTPANAAGKLTGNGIVFAGVDDQLKDTNQVWADANNTITVSMWNNEASANGAQNTTIFRYTSAGNERCSAHAPWGNVVYWDFGTCCTTGRISGDYTPYDDKYSLLHFVSNGSTNKIIYIDGVSRYSNMSAADAPAGALTGFAIGSGIDTEWYIGTVDEFRIATAVRTATWISTEYNNQNSPATFYSVQLEEPAPSGNTAPAAVSVSDAPDPVAVGADVTFSGEWTEDDAEDIDRMYVCKASDCANCNGTTQTGCWCYSSGDQTEPDVTDTCTYTALIGDVGAQSYWLGVCDDDPSCDATPLSGGTFTVQYATSSSTFTLSAWVKPTTAIATKAIAVKNNAIRLVTNSSGQPACQIYNGTAWQAGATSTTALALNSWQYVSCTYDRSNIKVYINGVLQATQAMSNVDIQDNVNALNLGYDAGAGFGYFQGYIDEFKYYKYARTADQIKSDYTGVATELGTSVRSVTVGEQYDQSDGLVAYWKMDESAWASGTAAVIDSSGNGNTGTVFGGADTTSTAKFGMAGNFDGDDDYVAVPGPGGIEAEGTISMWVYTDYAYSNGKNNYFFVSGYAQDYQRITFFYYDTGTARNLRIIFGNNTIKDTGYDATLSGWVYLTFTWVGVAFSTYANGEFINMTTRTALNGVPSTMYLGGDSHYDRHEGKLDDVKIYNKARTAEQIRRDYETGPPPVAHWKMDEGSGQTANDTSGNNHSGTLGSGSGSDSADPTWTQGKYGKGLKFDGNNDYVEIPDF